ncbi:MAG TPA: type II toxin-antitoxin system HicA family toxin [Ktedonobacteraceae bacterium]|nr:type II toxin-antitoxin system HicA family toxin [Ktedonobacteraceae bacterium]
MKLREMRAELQRLGFQARRGRGSHEIWTDPAQPRRRIVLSGAGGDDAQPYQVAKMRNFRRGMMIYCHQV